jgi:hypothetical protein
MESSLGFSLGRTRRVASNHSRQNQKARQDLPLDEVIDRADGVLSSLQRRFFRINWSAAHAMGFVVLLQLRVAMPTSLVEEVALHQRLLAGDPTAFPDLANAFLEPLIAWLVHKNSFKVSEDYCLEAAEEALIALQKNPASYDPGRGKRLGAYLRMSAQGDLKNILRSESRHWRKRKTLESVEDSPIAGNYLGVDDDPSLALQIQEEHEKATRTVVTPVRAGLSEPESRALDLMLQGERKTAAFAEALGIKHLPANVQQAEVKRVKDKLQKRLERGGGR